MVDTDMSAPIKNCTFLHCLFKDGSISFVDAVVDFKNCSFVSTNLGGGSSAVYNLDHCTLDIADTYNKNCNYKECLLFGTTFNTVRDGGGDAFGCVYVGDKETFFNNCSSATNRVYALDTQFLKEGGLYFELTDEKAAEWLGSDGSQVGMHGGSIPFDPRTSNPQISRFNVSSKTSSDGKLAVDIEVTAY